jgi:hypothetical protein
MEKTRVRVVGASTLYDNTDKSIVKIGSNYYFKSSNDVVKVKGRFYRRASPLVCKAFDGVYHLRKDVIITDEGLVINPSSPNIVQVDGKYYPKEFTTTLNGKVVLKGDTDIVTCVISGEESFSNNCEQLHVSYRENPRSLGRIENDRDKPLYFNTKFLSDADKIGVIVKLFDGGYALRSDVFEVMHEGNERLFTFSGRTLSGYSPVLSAGGGTQWVGGGLKVAHTVYAKNEDIVKCNFNYISPQNVYKPHKDLLLKQEEASCILANRELPLSAKKQVINVINEEEEGSKAVRISQNYAPTPGGEIFYDPQSKFKISPSSSKLGDIKYTFGVELETSAGNISDAGCKSINMMKAGDRSIGAYEYVTPVLHGNDGIDALEKACAFITERTLVDNRCGTHVHVGGMTGQSRHSLENPSYTEGSIEDKITFSVRAIQLGASIEDDIFNILPPNRVPTNKHCGTIKKYSAITRDNYNYLLGAYIFGGDDGQMKHKARLNNYPYDKYKGNGNSSKWQHSRYKWLNLLNLHTPRPTTVELRIFSGTTDFEKVYNFVLISLAFVRFVDSFGYILDDGGRPSLVEMLTTVYKSKPKILKQVLDFVNKRTAKFKKLRAKTI